MEYVRNCPKCECGINYKRKDAFKKANSKKSLCKKCSKQPNTLLQLGHKLSLKHSLSYSKEYKLWGKIKDRCLNENSKRFKDYGGRGILMDEKWLKDPVQFIDYIKTIDNYDVWLNDKSYSIDRIDNNLGYIEGNLRFTDKKTQATNRRNKKSNTNEKHIHKTIYNTFRLNINKVNYGSFKTMEECIKVRDSILQNDFAEYEQK